MPVQEVASADRHLPHPDQVTVYHLKDLTNGTKKHIKGKDVKHYNVPQYDYLSMDEFIGFAKNYPFVMMHLPDREKEIKKLSR